MIPGVLVQPTPAELFDTAARRFAAAVGEALSARGTAHIALSGGSTPAALYERLAMPEQRTRIDWKHVHVWWGDERAVPPDDPASNYRLARDILLRHLDLEPTHVHRMAADPINLEASALRYETELDGRLPPGDPAARFDLVLLGVGEDGHTASLFPTSPALRIHDRRVAAVTEAPNWPRLTLTLPVLNAARQIHVLATGIAKARAVSRALIGEPGPDCPVSLVRPTDGQLLWMIDSEADRLRSTGGSGGPGEGGAYRGSAGPAASRDARGTEPTPGPGNTAEPFDDGGPYINLPGEVELE
jgi:6-phosphogluconolactonase